MTGSVRRIAPVAAIGLVATNGPVLFFSTRMLDRSGRWEDHAVWPCFAAAAVACAVLFAVELRKGAAEPLTVSQKVAAVAVVWFCVAAALSTLWSVAPFETAWRSAVYAGLALGAWVISRLDGDEIAALLFAVTAAAVTASVAVVALWPDVGIDANGDWQGVYTNRNSLAPLAGLGLLVGARYLAAAGRRGRAAGGCLSVLCLATLIGAGSRTAWVALVIAAGAATAPVACHAARRRWGPSAGRAVLAGSVATGVAGCLIALALLWDTPTFSQRRTMWELVFDRVQERPLGGYGFYAFWEVIELLDHALLRRGSAHNSLVEVALGLGLLGTVPFVVIVVLAARNAAASLWRDPGADGWLWAAVVGFVLVENITESFVLWFSYMWMLLLAASLRPLRGIGPVTRHGDSPQSAPKPAGDEP